MSSSQVNHVFTALPNERTLRIPVKISVNNQIIETTAIINCGTTGSFIDPELIALAKFPLKKTRPTSQGVQCGRNDQFQRQYRLGN